MTSMFSYCVEKKHTYLALQKSFESFIYYLYIELKFLLLKYSLNI